ncbi:hypothetical protein L210DRAFT_990131 [Boletus edulis BED1]|uniref:Uncharacterized protein n=1 Tax=Boletus edulis BED1 TaxID=1328754 RepID=A0AAD4BBI9_BOLED|nr:hypothetical protein L210DRAFT_990131 [Boletus edulis BED1]
MTVCVQAALPLIHSPRSAITTRTSCARCAVAPLALALSSRRRPPTLLGDGTRRLQVTPALTLAITSPCKHEREHTCCVPVRVCMRAPPSLSSLPALITLCTNMNGSVTTRARSRLHVSASTHPHPRCPAAYPSAGYRYFAGTGMSSGTWRFTRADP